MPLLRPGMYHHTSTVHVTPRLAHLCGPLAPTDRKSPTSSTGPCLLALPSHGAGLGLWPFAIWEPH